MIMQVVNLRSSLSEDELLRIARERAPQFKLIPGLIQKYYLKRGNAGEYAGVYIWDSKESMAAFVKSDLANSIAVAYGLSEPPLVEVSEIMFPLRDL